MIEPQTDKTEQTPASIAITRADKPAYRVWLERLAPLAFYGLVAVLFTWPLVLHLGDRVIRSGSGDVWQHLWNINWIRFSLLGLHSQPYYTPLLFHPSGANLYFHALDPLDGYISTPFQVLFGLVTGFNLIILYQVALAGWGAYLLAAYLSGNRRAALVAGLIYACSPLESLFVNLGQLELTSIEWLPFYILCFIKSLNRAGRSWFWRGLSVLFLVFLALDSWYYVLYALLFSGLYCLYRLSQERREWRRQWPVTLVTTVGIIGIFFVLVLPVLLPTLHDAGTGGTTQPLYNVIYNSATLKGLVTTGPSLLWGLVGSGPNDEFRGTFLGFVALGLAGLGLVVSWRKGWFWGLTGLVFVVLALGPVLHLYFADWPNQQVAEQGLPLPGKLLFSLPFGNIARVPLRYLLITLLCLAVLAAFGLDWLGRRLAKQPWTAWALPLVAGILVFTEFMPGNRPLSDTTVSPFYQKLAGEGKWNDFAVLETPDRGDVSVISPAMYYEAIHGHPLVGGYLSRKPDYSFQFYPGIRELLNLDFSQGREDILARADLQKTLGVLQYYKIRYVIVHPQLLKPAQQATASEILQTVFGPTAQPVYQDSGLTAWRVPDPPATPAPAASGVLMAFNSTWEAVQSTPAGPVRPLRREARLSLFNPYQQPLQVTLSAPMQAADTTRLTLELTGQPAVQVILNAGTNQLSQSLTLQPGLNELVLQPDSLLLVGRLQLN